MATDNAPGTRPNLDELLKSFTPEDITALKARLGVKTELAEDQLSKALDGLEARLKAKPVQVTGTETDSTGFLKSLGASLDSLNGNFVTIGTMAAELAKSVKVMQTEVGTLRTENAALQGKLEQMDKALRLPSPGKAVVGGGEAAPHPLGENQGEGAMPPATLTKGGLLATLTEAFSKSTDAGVRNALNNEIPRVNAGGAPDWNLYKALKINIG